MVATAKEEQTLNNYQPEIVFTKANVFNEKKNELKQFSEKLPKETDLPSVPTSGGLFGLFKYDVTGNDLNRLTENIQDKMIEQNKVLVRTVQEFNTIYDTFSALDKEYIQGILISLRVAKEANNKAIKGLESVKVNQSDIEQMIIQQKLVIQVLEKHKEELEKIKHLKDIDKIFINFSTMQQNLSQQGKRIYKVESISAENKTKIQTLSENVVFQEEQFNQLSHSIQQDIQNSSKKNERNILEINTKIDSISNKSEKIKINIENMIKELTVGVEESLESMRTNFDSELTTTKSEITELRLLTDNLSRTLKVTQLVSFSSIALTVILVILIVSGVL